MKPDSPTPDLKSYVLFNKNHAALLKCSAKEALKLGFGNFTQYSSAGKIINYWDVLERSNGKIYIKLTTHSEPN